MRRDRSGPGGQKQDPPAAPDSEELAEDAPSSLTTRWAPDSQNAASSRADESLPLPARGGTLGHFVTLELLGRGGMAVVYGAYDPGLDRKVAIKLLRPEVGKEWGEEARQRLLREAFALGKLNHPNVVAVYEVGEALGQVFIAQEFVRGSDLKRWLRKKTPSVEEILDVFLQAGRGLAAAHAQGIIHRDFKPANVLLGDDGRVRVADFGLALPDKEVGSLEESADSVIARTRSASDSSLTEPGMTPGTPHYMALEQLVGALITPQTDQFSFCVALYMALYGERPFAGEPFARSAGSLESNIAAGNVRPAPRNSRVPGQLRRTLLKGLSAKPDDRYPGMEALLGELGGSRHGKRLAHRNRIIMAAVALVAIGGPIGVWYEFAVRRSKLCIGANAQIAQVWNPEIKREVQAALIGTGVSYAKDTAKRVVKAFDAYATSWMQMFTEACSATRVGGGQSVEVMDLRMRCLRRRIAELGALVKVFARADAGVLQKAVQASSSLTGIAMCADEEALRAPYPPPKTAEAEAKVAAIREKLAEVVALDKTGKYREGLEQARKLEEEANAVDYRPVQAEALYWLGWLLYRNGEFKTAEVTLHEAARAAGQSRDALLAAKVMGSLVGVAGFHQARPEEGLSLGRDAEVMLGVAGGDERIRANLLNDMGIVLASKGEHDKGLTYLRKALAIKKEALGPDHPLVAQSLNNLGVVFWTQGKYDKALEYYRNALAIRKKVLGPEHPALGYTLNNMGLVYWKNGNYDKAHEHLRNALAIWEKALGPEHPAVAWPLIGIGNVFADQGRPQQAIGPLERALSVCGKKTCEPEPHGRGLFALARALVATDGDNERAIRLAAEARGVFGKAPYLKKELEQVNTWLKERGAE